ncbi:MAG: MBOAT family protein [Chloroflexi bacterium]|jgi:alginate O-acetyltransferase complex protein AlgI|nr:MBOAT family protein [Chloroflexota bacterium]MBT3668805.1 MBOAT family protein [Chloroflexota bacterium]MBT4003814.1 MBOAT family protein [Chloroflexota bacterium]MBT4306519.1 MBOAT family protein [Chloroflexota bacterium]MBT4533903.1 MBOAT family protein [Chloroflexota bacterium]
MNLLSKVFLLGFLPLSTFIYWKLLKTPRTKLWGLLIFSFIFYSFAGWQYSLLLIALSLLTFGAAKQGWYWLGILANLIALIFFKYWDFGVVMLRRFLNDVDWSHLFPILHLALPLGISFYIFKHIAYLLDVKNQRYLPTDNFLVFLTFSAFFPQISAGPISNFKDTGQQFIDLPNKFENKNAYNALIYITLGIAKKLIIAQGISSILATDFYLPGQGSILAFWTSSLLQGLYLYMDFSGYTDIALGIGYLFGIKLPGNFDNPFLAKNPSDFWNRWHISLSLWFRVYIFAPISRYFLKTWKGRFRELAQYAANWITMTLVGLWHGANSQYLIWGFFHGSFLNFHAWAVRKNFKWVGTWIDKTITLIGIIFSWHLFFTGWKELRITIPEAFGINGFGSFRNLLSEIPPHLFPVLIISILISFSGFAEAIQYIKIRSKLFGVIIGAILVLMIAMLGEPLNFNYVQF